MNGSGLIQVLVMVAAVVLAGIAVFKAYRRSKSSAGGGGAQDRAPGSEDGNPENPSPSGQAEDPAGSAMGLGSVRLSREPLPRMPWQREDSVSIRAKSWQLFSAQYGRILILMAVVAAISAAQTLASTLLPEWAWLRLLWAILIPLALAPIDSAGSAYAALHVYRGEPPRVRLLASFLSPRRFFRAIGLVVLQGLIMLLPGMLVSAGLMVNLRSTLYQPAMGGSSDWIAPAVLIIPGIIAMLWLALRISIIPYALARRPETGANKAFETGFRATGGRIGALIGMYLSTGWPVVVFYGLATWLSRQAPKPVASITDWIVILFVALYSGYPWLASAGLADKLLADDEARFVEGQDVAEGKASIPDEDASAEDSSSPDPSGGAPASSDSTASDLDTPHGGNEEG